MKVLGKPAAVKVADPSRVATYFSNSVLESKLLLPFKSTHRIRPSDQSEPEVAQVVAVAAMQSRTARLLAPASLRAKDKSPTNSLIWPLSRLLVIKEVNAGTAMPSNIARMDIVTINSMSVKPWCLTN